MLGLIEAGFVPMPLFEGDYNTRLDIIKDIPKGKAIYWFEDIDIYEAKKVLGDRVCIRGNLPGTMLQFGTPGQVRDYVRELIDVLGRDGGLIVDTGTFFDEAKHENVRAHGRYGKAIWCAFRKYIGFHQQMFGRNKSKLENKEGVKKWPIHRLFIPLTPGKSSEQLLAERTQRLADAVAMKQPDRVPVFIVFR